MYNGRLYISNIKVKQYLNFLALWLCYAFLSLTWAADRVSALRDAIFLFSGISIVFFLVYYFRDLNSLKWLYWLLLLIFIALIPIGVWEVITGNHLSNSGLLFIDEGYEFLGFVPTTVFGNQNNYATYIALTLPMVLVCIRYYHKLYSRILGTAIFISGLSLLVITTSRGGCLGVLTGLIFWFIFLLDMKTKFKVLAISVCMYLFFTVIIPDQTSFYLAKLNSRMSSLSTIGTGLDEGISVRENLIKNAISFAVKSVGFGVGAGNVEYYMANYPIYPVGEITNVHNWWLEILSNYGVFILGGYIILYIKLFLNLWKAYKRMNNCTERMICEALLVGWVSFFMVCTSASSLMAFDPQWIYLGFVLAFLNYVRITETSRVSKCMS
jgi:teichuronic acid biosynthesis protein TuaE